MLTLTNDELNQSVVGGGKQAFVVITFIGLKAGTKLVQAACKAMKHHLDGNPGKHGLQRLKDLSAKNTERSLFEVDGKLDGFDKYAEKYRIDHSVIYDQAQDKTLLVFQGKDTEMINQAFKEYSQEVMQKNQSIEKVDVEIVEPIKLKPLELSDRADQPLLEAIYRPLELSSTPEQQALAGRSEQPLLSSPAEKPNHPSLFDKISAIEAKQARMENPAHDMQKFNSSLGVPLKNQSGTRASVFEKIGNIEAVQSGAGKAFKAGMSKGGEMVSKGAQTAVKGAETAAKGAAQTAGAAASAGATVAAEAAMKTVTAAAKQVQKTVSHSLER